MPVFLPIKQRALRKEVEVVEDPITRKISNGVLIIATGLLIILVGIFLSVIGNRKGASHFRLFGGIAIVIIGTMTSIAGGFIYAVNWRKKHGDQQRSPTDEEVPNSPEGGNSRKMLTRGTTSDDDLSDNDLETNHKVTRALSNQGYTCELKSIQKDT